jgi:hypothetical protein
VNGPAVKRDVGAITLTLAAGGLALGCGDPVGPPARAYAPVAPLETATAVTPTPAVEPPRATQPVLDDEPLERLVTSLRGDPDPDQRRRAIDAYARRVVTDAASVEPLIEAVATDLDPLVRRWAALALANAATPDVRPRLRLLAASERDPVVRSILERPEVERAARPAHPGGLR